MIKFWKRKDRTEEKLERTRWVYSRSWIEFNINIITTTHDVCARVTLYGKFNTARMMQIHDEVDSRTPLKSPFDLWHFLFRPILQSKITAVLASYTDLDNMQKNVPDIERSVKRVLLANYQTEGILTYLTNEEDKDPIPATDIIQTEVVSVNILSIEKNKNLEN